MVRLPHRRPNRRLEGNSAFFPSQLLAFRAGVASQTNLARSGTSRHKCKRIDHLRGQAASAKANVEGRLTRQIPLSNRPAPTITRRGRRGKRHQEEAQEDAQAQEAEDVEEVAPQEALTAADRR
jgi:hypothetical protein